MANGGFHVDLPGADDRPVPPTSSPQSSTDPGNQRQRRVRAGLDHRRTGGIRSVRLANGLPSQFLQRHAIGHGTRAPNREHRRGVQRSRIATRNSSVAALIGSGDHVSLYLLLDATANGVDRLASSPTRTTGWSQVGSMLDST